MPTNTDKGHSEKDGGGTGGGQKATYGSGRSPEVADAAKQAIGTDGDDNIAAADE